MIDKNLCCNNIRIWAMSKDEEEFKNKTYLDVQREFFLGKLVYNDGEFLYHEKGLNSPEDTLVLFKFDNQIIASALFKRKDEEKKALYFDISTIEVFNPINEKQLSDEIPDFTLSTRGQNIEVDYLDVIINLINKNIEKGLGIYDSYKKIIGENHSFTEDELKKILFHLVKNHEYSNKCYSIESGAENNEYVLHSSKGSGYIQVDEFRNGKYKVIINLGGADYNNFNTDRFNQLLKLKF